MKDIAILVIELIFVIFIVILGLTNKQFMFINSARSAVITLGIIGMCFCGISIGKFITNAPFHGFTIMAYVVGTIALACFITQLFKLNLPIIANPKNALLILAVSIIIKGIIARFGDVLVK
ncbi:hypothetical protein IMX26_06770 [Clostridium sp. 'deep sea']|uniref:hypothetical protein n=1 Tax=Clostridium sp. 'deep sea' TaxID=2779445 RepID=UPI0018964E28|nr:hypothetical protein [Clostridium sp. 'deep sea']QOR36507.1 hypothetical protein IMX26_06770 [Clostridium sp. 'deep sea']